MSKHFAIIGALGVGALYLVSWLYSGQLLYYAGPGDPLWIDDIFFWWQIVFGGMFGMGIIGWTGQWWNGRREGYQKADLRVDGWEYEIPEEVR